MNLPAKIDVAIEPKHFAAATEYSDISGCPLYQAMIELYPDAFVTVTHLTVRIGLNDDSPVYLAQYEFDGYAWGSGNMYDPETINFYIGLANHGKIEEVPTVNLLLTRID